MNLLIGTTATTILGANGALKPLSKNNGPEQNAGPLCMLILMSPLPPLRGKPEPLARDELYGYGSPLVCVRVGGVYGLVPTAVTSTYTVSASLTSTASGRLIWNCFKGTGNLPCTLTWAGSCPLAGW